MNGTAHARGVLHSGNQLEIAYLPDDAVLHRLHSSSVGLSQKEALERLQRHGQNTIEVELPVSLLKKVIGNFWHPMAILLWVTGLVALAARMPQLAVAIWLVNLINGSFSFWQEHRAERAVDALNKLLPVNVKVLRDNQPAVIPAADLVPGDLVTLDEGDRISADMRLLACQSLEIDQSTLTGESRPVRKAAGALERLERLERCVSGGHLNGVTRSELTNLVYAGTTVLSGHGQAVVFATGTATEFGRIAHLTQTIVDQPSPLQMELQRLTRIVSLFSITIGVAMFIAARMFTHTDTAQAFIFALGMIVAFVPEGMVPTVTLSLALAVQRMVKRNALVKRLSSVEALGSCNIICTDKTGTLTENQMTVTRAYAAGTDYEFGGLGYSLAGAMTPCSSSGSDSEILELLRAGVWCNNARVDLPASSFVSGDPTEIALLIAAGKAGQPVKCIAERVGENVFDSRRKCMSTVHSYEGKKVAYVKGSPSQILDKCTSTLVAGVEKELDASLRHALFEQINAYARDGLRVIGAARKILAPDETDFTPGRVENELCFLGLFAMYDPPREGVSSAVDKCRNAGIQVVMITGDYEVTADAIARKVGIIRSGKANIITGPQLEHMSEQEFIESLKGELIFARVNPEHKLRIVNAFQRCGKIVAVTGDGVNDAPALKKADIGVAMGQSGADVAKESADMILLDDNFASIVSAIEEGRSVYDNIKKFAVYVFNSNMAEAVPFVVMLLSCGLIPMPLTVMQVLFIDLGTDMVPALGLGTDPAERGIMERKPRCLKQPLLSGALLAKALLWYGAIEAVAGMSGYFFLNWLHGWPTHPLALQGSLVWRMATSMTLTCIVCSQIGAVFCCRTNRESLLSINLFENRLIVAGVFVEFALLAALFYCPFMNRVFDTAPLGAVELLFAFSWVPIMFVLDEARKALLRQRLQA